MEVLQSLQTLEIIPLVMIITGVIKPYIPKQYVPLVPIVLGLALAIASNQDVSSVMNGVLAGIGAVGTYGISKGVLTSTADDTDTKSAIDALKGLLK